MKKVTLFAIIAALTGAAANASDYYETTIRDCNPAAMRAALDKASFEERAVITVVTCNNGASRFYDAKDAHSEPLAEYSADNSASRDVAAPRAARCADCSAPVERVVARRHYVEETVQRYEPVVQYVPAGTYKRTRRVCSECDM